MENSERESSGADPSGRGWVQTLFDRRGVFGVCFVLVAGLVYLAALVKIYLSPTDYLASVVVEFRPADGERPDFEREVGILKTGGVLANVEKELKLARNWDMTPAEAVVALREKIEVEPLGSPQLARISVYHTEAMLAARIADAIPDGYRLHKSRKGVETTAYKEEQLIKQLDELAIRKDATFDAWDMQRRRSDLSYEGVAEEFEPLADQQASPASASAPTILDSGFMIEATPGLPIAAVETENIEVDSKAVSEAKAAYDRVVAETEELQAALDKYKEAVLAVPPALLVHEHAVIPSNPARPVVEDEMRSAAWRAVGLGVLSGLIGMLLISAWGSRAKIARGTPPTPPPATDATVAGATEY